MIDGTLVNQTILSIGYHSYSVSVTVNDADNDDLVDTIYVDNEYETIEIMSKRSWK